jgi:hypothetical protein
VLLVVVIPIPSCSQCEIWFAGTFPLLLLWLLLSSTFNTEIGWLWCMASADKWVDGKIQLQNEICMWWLTYEKATVYGSDYDHLSILNNSMMLVQCKLGFLGQTGSFKVLSKIWCEDFAQRFFLHLLGLRCLLLSNSLNDNILLRILQSSECNDTFYGNRKQFSKHRVWKCIYVLFYFTLLRHTKVQVFWNSHLSNVSLSFICFSKQKFISWWHP